MVTRADQIAQSNVEAEGQYQAAPPEEKPAIEAILVELHQNPAPLVEAGACSSCRSRSAAQHMTNITHSQQLSYPIGTKVRWFSSNTWKEGVYLGDIPPGIKPIDLFAELRNISIAQDRFGSGKGVASSNRRAYIRADRVGAKGAILKPHYYGARPSLLEVIPEVGQGSRHDVR